MIIRFLILTLIVVEIRLALEWHYHNNQEVAQLLKSFTETPNKNIQTRLYSIGKTIKGNDLWVVEITASKAEKIGVPNIKFIGTIHGNEPVGREMILHFMEYLRDNYKKDSAVTWLLDHSKIHLLPNLNPDGFAISHEGMCGGEHGRNNGLKGVDLNRNFPDFFRSYKIPEEPETQAVKGWLAQVPFILSGALHGGALVTNYPFDTVEQITSYEKYAPSLTPDDDVFVHLASTYALHHPLMRNASCPLKFEGGITNGAAWYPIIGGMQDYNYAFHGCMEVTLEISCCKYPKAKELPNMWKQNKIALVQYSLQAFKGVTGQILDSSTFKPVVRAALRISGRNMTFYSHKTGEFWRLLLPGRYRLEVSAEGYYKEVVPFVVENYVDSMPELTYLDVFLINSSVSTTSAPTTIRQETVEVSEEFSMSSSDGAPTSEYFTVSDDPVANKLADSQGRRFLERINYVYVILLALFKFFMF